MENQQTAPEGFILLPKEHFTGTTWLKMRVDPDDVKTCTISEVIFEPGNRKNLHITNPFSLFRIKQFGKETGKKIDNVI